MLPILYQNNDLIVYSYPLLMGIGWGAAYQIYFSLMSQTIPRLKAQMLFWGVFISAWFGAKVLFLITLSETNASSHAGELSFWTGGGFVFYGGLLAAISFLAIFKLVDKNLKFIELWPVVPALAFGHGIGRLGCFLAGCCFGKPTDFFWGVFMHDHYRHPTQLLEATGLIIAGIFLMRSKASKFMLFSGYLIYYGILRLFIEALRGDSIRGQWGFFTPSQWISLGLIFTGISLILSNKNKPLVKT